MRHYPIQARMTSRIFHLTDNQIRLLVPRINQAGLRGDVGGKNDGKRGERDETGQAEGDVPIHGKCQRKLTLLIYLCRTFFPL